MKHLFLCLGILFPVISYSEPKTDVECLAHNIYHESRNQPTPAQFAVGFVTMNRVRSNGFPNTVCEVVKQKHQFSWYWDGLSDKPREYKAYRKAKKIATMILAGIFPDNTSGALFYHSHKVKPYWAKHFKFIVKLEDHLFYRYKNSHLNVYSE